MPTSSGTSESLAHPAAEGLIRNAGLPQSMAETFTELIRPIEHYPAAAVISSFARTPRLKWILNGWTCEMRVLPDGRRQIFSFGIPGDPVLSRPVNRARPCCVVALTSVECIDVAQTLVRAKDAERVAIWKAMNDAVGLARERRYEDVVRLGRRSALQRLADLLLELHDRLDQIGVVNERSFYLPLTQEHLADALGLSVVHVSRSLKALRLQGGVTFRFSRVSHVDRARLVELAQGLHRADHADVLPSPTQ
ncbi:Crp/Fnr family transcriptional regulator [Phenylobacterium sp. LjRoot225]|uniref:Crp/Fnr family transcriptional regulator n=1 Tax=Phenylobacterium sp. LjRoot225 TaxID=3342285 RepID=UPI003ECCDD4E